MLIFNWLGSNILIAGSARKPNYYFLFTSDMRQYSILSEHFATTNDNYLDYAWMPFWYFKNIIKWNDDQI